MGSTVLRFTQTGLSSCNATQMNGEFFELQIAREILATVRRCELPLQLDSLTEADGNCFPRAIVAQCTDDGDGSETPINHFSLRSNVAKFARESQCPKIVELKENYDEAIETASGKSWDDYWEISSKPGEWV